MHALGELAVAVAKKYIIYIWTVPSRYKRMYKHHRFPSHCQHIASDVFLITLGSKSQNEFTAQLN